MTCLSTHQLCRKVEMCRRQEDKEFSVIDADSGEMRWHRLLLRICLLDYVRQHIDKHHIKFGGAARIHFVS